MNGNTVMTPKLVPGPLRMLTAAVVRTVLPAGKPPAVVAVGEGVRVGVNVSVGGAAVLVEVAGPDVFVGVAEALETTARYSPATQPWPYPLMLT